MATTPIRPPRLAFLALELAAIGELGLMAAASPLLTLAKRGDGHPVLVIPGFTADDNATAPLRKALALRGHNTHGWGLGRNVGSQGRLYDGAARLAGRLADEHGVKVSVVGWSLGGLYARELAREYPDVVRSVITMASPFRMRSGDVARATGLYHRLAPYDPRFVGHLDPEHERPPIEPPTTSLYVRTDGITRWHTCIDVAGPTTENIEVIGTHSGLMFNLAAIFAIADRLAQPEGDWKPFKPPPLVRAWYPRPASWREAEAVAYIEDAEGEPATLVPVG
jgi:pimeloyl-ACP methyl ester carboxylesterase